MSVIPRAARALCLVLVLGGASLADAQSLASRVAAVVTGEVSFHFAARPGVCGDGLHFIRTGKHQYHGSWNDHRGMEPCYEGPVQVRLTLEDGAVNRVQYWVGPLRDRVARDLGAVPAVEAARYLMTLVSNGAPRVSAKAVMPAVLADSAVVWPVLLAVAKDGFRSNATRRETMLWLSRFASAAVAGRPNDPFLEIEDGTEDDDLKRHAVFVLSQLPRNEGIPQLIDVAKSNQSWRVRSQAFFWLGQSSDSRVIPVFESVLR
jgi:HEAT repeat protein